MTNSDTIGGRKQGTRDPLAGDLRRMILGALEDAGGREYLTKLAKESPSIFLGFVAKMISAEAGGKDGGPSETPEMSDLEVARRLAFLLARGAQELESA